MSSYNVSKTATVNYWIKQSDTFYDNFIVKWDGDAVDLSVYTSAKLQVRESEIADPVLTLSSSGGTINLSNLSAGQIILSGSTSSIEANSYYYDLELRNANTYQTVTSGRFNIVNDYSR